MQRVGLFLSGVVLSMPGQLLAASSGQEAKQKLCEGAGLGCTKVDGSGHVVDSAGKPVDLTGGLSDSVNNITNTLLYVAGAVAVIVIIIAGLRYVTSSGDAARIKQAKDTILYAIVGLIVAILAYAIVRFIAINVT